MLGGLTNGISSRGIKEYPCALGKRMRKKGIEEGKSGIELWKSFYCLNYLASSMR